MNEHILTLARENAPCYLYEYDVMKAAGGDAAPDLPPI